MHNPRVGLEAKNHAIHMYTSTGLTLFSGCEVSGPIAGLLATFSVGGFGFKQRAWDLDLALRSTQTPVFQCGGIILSLFRQRHGRLTQGPS